MKNNMNKYNADVKIIAKGNEINGKSLMNIVASGAFIRNLPGSSQCKRLSAGYVSADCF